jgi:hypothetical protein
MSERTISPEEGLLLLHRFISERKAVDVWFFSGDVTVNMEGFVSGSNGEELHVVSDLETKRHFIMLRSMSEVTFGYADYVDLPGSKFCLGLRLHLKNGDSLTIMEKRDQKP